MRSGQLGTAGTSRHVPSTRSGTVWTGYGGSAGTSRPLRRDRDGRGPVLLGGEDVADAPGGRPLLARLQPAEALPGVEGVGGGGHGLDRDREVRARLRRERGRRVELQ